MTEDPNDMLGGGAFAKFPTIGTGYVGTITRWFVDPTATRFDGTPEPCPTIWLQLEDGTTVVIPLNNGSKKYAIRQALQEAAAKGLEEGGRLGFEYHEDGEAKTGQSPPKLYKAGYRPRAAAIATAADSALAGL